MKPIPSITNRINPITAVALAMAVILFIFGGCTRHPNIETRQENQDKAVFSFKETERLAGAAQEKIQNGNTEKAGEYLERTLKTLNRRIKSHPDDSRAYALRSKVFTLTGDKEKAVRDMKHAAAISPGNIDLQVGYAYALSDTGKNGKALSVINKAEKTARNKKARIALWKARAVVLRNLDRDHEAVKVLGKVAEHAPDKKERVRATLLILDIYVDHDRIEKAEQYLNRYNKMDPDKKNLGLLGKLRRGCLYRNIGAIYFHYGKFTKAEKAFAKSLIIDPDHLNAYVDRAMCLYLTGDKRRAKEVIKIWEAREKPNPEDPHKIYFRTMAYMVSDRNNDALKEINRAIKKADDYKLYGARAMILYVMGRKEYKDDYRIFLKNATTEEMEHSKKIHRALKRLGY